MKIKATCIYLNTHAIGGLHCQINIPYYSNWNNNIMGYIGHQIVELGRFYNLHTFCRSGKIKIDCDTWENKGKMSYSLDYFWGTLTLETMILFIWYMTQNPSNCTGEKLHHIAITPPTRPNTQKIILQYPPFPPKRYSIIYECIKSSVYLLLHPTQGTMCVRRFIISLLVTIISTATSSLVKRLNLCTKCSNSFCFIPLICSQSTQLSLNWTTIWKI